METASVSGYRSLGFIFLNVSNAKCLSICLQNKIIDGHSSVPSCQKRHNVTSKNFLTNTSSNVSLWIDT